MSRLTNMQRKFVDEYIVSGNAKEAAIKAGYAKKSAGSNSDRLFKTPAVAEYMKQQMDKAGDASVADAHEVLKYLTRVMRGEETETVATAKGLYGDVPVKASDRNKAAELLGKRLRLFVDKRETDVTVKPVTITDDIPKQGDDGDG